MARAASIAVGGFFPTPVPVLKRIIPFFAGDAATIVDPCAGEGIALYAFRDYLRGKAYGVEMEATRFNTLKAGEKWGDMVAHGDFFHLQYDKLQGLGANVMYLNPPYDTDKVYGRLEERFLKASIPLMYGSGWLVYVVPYYALKASADTLATHFQNFVCYKFHDTHWDAYKQVVLFAQRKPSVLDPKSRDKILGWAADADTIEVLPESPPFRINLPSGGRSFSKWVVVGFDERETVGIDPWQGSIGLRPPIDIAQHFNRTYPVASPPRAAHLAAALAAGVFNGMEITSDNPSLSPLLIKGTFDRDWKKVEDKTNSKGEKVGELEVQAPKLSVSVLDIGAGKFYDVIPDASTSNTIDVSNLTMGDLLDQYGKSLMQGMINACPVLHDPSRGDACLPMAPVQRPLFDAQFHAVQTALKLRNENPQRGVILLGEIGAGKSSVALATAATLNMKRLLILAPPHLLDGWRDQTSAVLGPSVPFTVLESLGDVDTFFSPGDEMRVAVLSRERAKLGHGLTGVAATHCPDCGTKLPEQVDFVKKRYTCNHSYIPMTGFFPRWMRDFFGHVYRYVPNHFALPDYVQGRHFHEYLSKHKHPKPYPGLSSPAVDMLRALVKKKSVREHSDLMARIAWACPSLAKELLLLVKGESQTYLKVAWTLDPQDFPIAPDTTSSYSWGEYVRQHKAFWTGGYPNAWSAAGQEFKDKLYHKTARGSVEALGLLIDGLVSAIQPKRVRCGSRMWQASPDPRRFPLAQYIMRRHRESYDMLIVDEMHEFSSSESAQTKAAQRLMDSKAFKLGLTGSLMNGYSDSVFMNMNALSPKFRDEFGRDHETLFVDRYGYWKRVVEERDSKGKVIEFGTNSDRVTRSSRKVGIAPGILPLFQLDHLLPMAVTLQKEDLNLNIPPCTETIHPIIPTDTQMQEFTYLFDELKQTIKENRGNPELANKLWGAVAHIPGYFDLACTGNHEEGYVVKWPDSVMDGAIIAKSNVLPDPVLPKEQWMLDTVRDEIDEGRRVMVLGWHTNLLPRWTTILKREGYKVAFLDAGKVPTEKRQAWIDQHVVAKGVDVLVVNPVAVQTGLNNLVYFATQLWMENPMCNPAVYRQACGRVDRIGQTLPTRIMFALYDGTPQNAMHKLLLHKIGVSKAVDGLDPEDALRAAGLLDSEFSGFSIGKQLFKMLTDG